MENDGGVKTQSELYEEELETSLLGNLLDDEEDEQAELTKDDEEE